MQEQIELKNELDGLFDKYDANGDGYLEKEDIAKMLQEGAEHSGTGFSRKHL